MGMSRISLFCLLQALALPALAARPFVTDDARLTTAGSCQLESWVRIYPDSRELWALPACNPFGNLELTAGGGKAKNDGQPSSGDYIFQLKTLLRPLETNGWGLGLAAGTVHHPQVNPGPNLLGNTFVYMPVSVSFADDRIVMHANVGWLKDKASGEHRTTWGLGWEFRLNEHITGIAESFGDNSAGTFWQAGARFAIIPERVQVDATLGRELNGPASSRWISFGLRLTPDRLF